MRFPRSIALFIVLLTGLLAVGSPVTARQGVPSPLRVTQQPDGVLLEWQARADLFSLNRARLEGNLVEVGGLQLPARLVALYLPDSRPVRPRIERLDSVSWSGQLPSVKPAIPRTAGGEARPALAASADGALPTSPVVLLREGQIRGQRVVVLAITPIFEREGRPHQLTVFRALIEGAQLQQEGSAPSTASATFTPTGPRNPAATGRAVKIEVTHAGIQRLTGSQLAAAGLALETTDPTLLQLYHEGSEVAIELRGTSDGRLDPADELRFYATTPGDRWNSTDSYWLVVGSLPGARMSTRDTLPGSAPLRTTALDRGAWGTPALYDSTLPGPDGDHWFAADLRTGPGQPAASLGVPLTPTLPLVSGSSTFTVTGSAYTRGTHQLRLTTGSNAATSTWQGTGDWSFVATLPENPASVQLVLVPGSEADGVEPNRVEWERPVRLEFGGQGAPFRGISGSWRYQLAGLPGSRTLYDISDPVAPVILTLPTGSTATFQDGPAARSYLLAAPGTLHLPRATAYSPSALLSLQGAELLYIAPASFHKALAPLVAQREAQGHSVQLVDVQALYDHWSYGQVSPDAIRDFLRHATATWQPAPLAVTLVGDGTLDPLNHTGRNNINYIPPYLARVDPWLGETACEPCYAQLDGETPFEDALPDVALGRLPVKSIAELERLVEKILAYENEPAGIEWRARALFIADNYRDAQNRIDEAGDFAAHSDRFALDQPAGLEIQRLYYDPSPSHEGVPWREPDPVRAHERTKEALNRGYGLVTYTGHGNHWQWAVTDPTASPPHLLGLYDTDGLTNQGRPSLLLAMTCLTSAFHEPAYSGTTIDERLLLHPDGGAIAVWGPAGLGVSHGHDLLQEGFYARLWSAEGAPPSVGELTLAGYLKLFTEGNCCQDTLRTFVLLGDPMMPARVIAANRLYLPAAVR